MEITILAASGATGLELTRQALERGHTVTAIARTPDRIAVPDSSRLIRVAADVRDRHSIAAALSGQKVVLSGLGIASGDKPGALTAGARAVVAGRPECVVWLGAYGTGPSARVAGAATRTLLKMMGAALVVSRATVAAAMLDEAENPAFAAMVAIPLER